MLRVRILRDLEDASPKIRPSPTNGLDDISMAGYAEAHYESRGYVDAYLHTGLPRLPGDDVSYLLTPGIARRG